MIKLICISLPQNITPDLLKHIKVGGLYDAELMRTATRTSWPVEMSPIPAIDYSFRKLWKVYLHSGIFIYSYTDDGEFMELSEYRNKQLDKLGIDI